MAASYAASMQAIGLPALSPSACAETFQRAGYSGKAILANLDISKFSQVNQVRSKWSYVSQLAMLPKVQSLQEGQSICISIQKTYEACDFMADASQDF